MRVVLDTNILVSALLWNGAPRDLLTLIKKGDVQLVTCGAILAEL